MVTSIQYRRLTVSLLLFCIATFAFAGLEHRSFACTQSEPFVCETENDICQDAFSVRGGDWTSESKINDFLSKLDVHMDKFHVHGWRWHTMSLVREAGRLKQLAQRSSSNQGCGPIKEASDYVVGFNMKGLHKIEADLFFPWMRNKLTAVEQKDLAQAFGSVMDQLESDRKQVAKLGESIQRRVNLLCDESRKPVQRTDSFISIARDAAELESCARSMMNTENTLLVPSLAEIVPEREQKAFNNKVLRNLGILDSRLHLVGMHEAVWESNIPEEKEMFKKAIPSIPQALIPRWKRTLYIPRTNVLD